MTPLDEWATRWGVPPQALAELAQTLHVVPDSTTPRTSEGAAQQKIRLASPHQGLILWRNNTGVRPDERGVPIRFGLANDSKKVNEKVKSSDLIGVGSRGWPHQGRFIAVETKRPGWKFNPRDEAQAAQKTYHDIVNAAGGIAFFATCPEDVARGLRL